MLATSRAPLRLSREHVVPLGPFRRQCVGLFVELAAARGVVLREDASPSVREICQRLDGLPLAIELVAARLVVLPPAHILERWTRGWRWRWRGRSTFPSGNGRSAQRSNGATGSQRPAANVARGARRLRRRCTLDDARALAGREPRFLADLEALVAWSLLRSDVADGGVRLSMLETVREHAVSRLDTAGSSTGFVRGMPNDSSALASTAEAELTGAAHAEWLDRLEQELDNIRAMLDWCLSSGRVEDALRAIAALDRFWRAHAHGARRADGSRWASGSRATCRPTSAQMPCVPRPAGDGSERLGAQLPLLEDARTLFRRVRASSREVKVLAYLGGSRCGRGAGTCRRARVRSRWRSRVELGDPAATAAALMTLADVRSRQGDRGAALAEYEEAVTVRHGLGIPSSSPTATYNLGVSAFEGGNLERARQAFEESSGSRTSWTKLPWCRGPVHAR